MCLNPRFALSAMALMALLLNFCLATGTACAQTKSETNSVVSAADLTNAVAAAQLEALGQLQAQQKVMLQVLEASRLEIAAALATSSSNNLLHLNAMTEVFALQRAQDMRMLRDANRVVLAILVGTTGLLLLSILFLNFSSVRALNRLATVFQANALVPSTGDAMHDSRQLLLFPGEEGQRQLGAALVQLQGRIQSLEHSAHSAVKAQPSDAHHPSVMATNAAALQVEKAPA